MKTKKTAFRRLLSCMTMLSLLGGTLAAGFSAGSVSVNAARADGSFYFGDLNGDDGLDEADVQLYQDYFAHTLSMTDEQRMLADTDGNGTIDETDLQWVQQYMAGETGINDFPVYDTLTDYGYYTDHLKYILTDWGKMTVFGSGAMPDSPEEVPWTAHKAKVEMLVIDNGVTSVGAHTFSAHSALTDIQLSDTVRTIGAGAFEECTGLEVLTLPQAVESLGSEAFLNCSSLMGVLVLNPRLEIGTDAFKGCPSLVFTGKKGSTAEAYAKSAGIPFVVRNEMFRDVSLHAFDGSVTEILGLGEKRQYGSLPTPSERGYIFKGWNLSKTTENSSLFEQDTKIYFQIPSSWKKGNNLVVYCHLWNVEKDKVLYSWMSGMEKCDLYCDGIYSYTIPAGSDVDAVIFFTNQYDQTNDISLSTVCANDMLTVSDPSDPIVIASSVWGENRIECDVTWYESEWTVHKEFRAMISKGAFPERYLTYSSTSFSTTVKRYYDYWDNKTDRLVNAPKDVVVSSDHFVSEKTAIPLPIDHDLYSVWEPADAYTLTYVLNSDTDSPEPSTVYSNETVTVTEDVPVKDGYSFRGFSINPYAVEGELHGGETIPVTGDIVLYAVWRKEIASLPVQLSPSSFTYDGTEKCPQVTVMDGSEALASHEYTVEYSDNTEAGTGKVTIKGRNHYIGQMEVTFPIGKRSIVDCQAEIGLSEQAYLNADGLPEVTVKDGEKTLVQGTDYTVLCERDFDERTAQVTVTGTGNYSGTVTKSFEFPRKPVFGMELSISPLVYTYDGNAKTPDVTVKDGEKLLVPGVDYTVLYTSNINAGTAGVTVTGEGSYAGTLTGTFTISPASVSNMRLISTPSSVTYDGSEQKPSVTVMNGTQPLVPETDYTVQYAQNVHAGTGQITVYGAGNYTGTLTGTFTINPASITDMELISTPSNVTYDGSEQKPSVTVLNGAQTLVKGMDYTVQYTKNIHAGTAQITVIGTGDYTGTLNGTFEISRKPITNLQLTITPSFFMYDGNGKKPRVTVMDGDNLLNEETDYTVTYHKAADAGTAEVIVSGTGDYTGILTGKFDISQKPVTDMSLTIEPGTEIYDGTPKKPTVIVKDGEKILVPETDYSVKYVSNTNVGTAQVTVVGKGNYTGTLSGTFEIVKKSVADMTLTVAKKTYVYSGTKKTPSVVVKDSGTALISGTDYTVQYASNINAGTAKVIVTGKGNYSGTLNGSFTISRKSITGMSLTVAAGPHTYDGSLKIPAVTVENGTKTLASGIDYAVSYTDNTNAGQAQIKVTGKGNYTGTLSGSFAIEPRPITDFALTLKPSSFTYDGGKKEPTVTVKDGDKTLTVSKEYTVKYTSNTDAGTAKVTVTGVGNYGGTLTKSFRISKKQLTETTVSIGNSSSLVYDGVAKTPSILIKQGDYSLTIDQDYSVTYQNNINAGTGTALITGKGNYSGTLEKTFTIKKRPISNASVTVKTASYQYDGKAKKPTVTVTLDGVILERTTDYSVAYQDNTEVGTARVTITGKNNYTGTATATFMIQQAVSKFTWGADNWNFNNSTSDGSLYNSTYREKINATYLNALKNALSNSEYTTVFSGYGREKAWLDTRGGSCYGMAATLLLAKKGLMKFSDYQSGAQKAYQLDRPASKGLDVPSVSSNLSSLITYYQMLQVKDVTRQQHRSVPNYSNKINIENIISLLKTESLVLVGFKKDGFGGHAVVAYGYGYSSKTINNNTYDGYIQIYDPNYSLAENNKAYIWFKRDSYDWIIPAYAADGVNSKLGAKFNYVCADINVINKGGYLGKNYYNTQTSDYIARIDANQISNNRSVSKMQESHGIYMNQSSDPGDIVEDYSMLLSGSSTGTIGYNLFDPDAAYKVSQEDADALDLYMDYESCDLSAYSSSGKSVLFDNKGLVRMESDGGQYSLSMTFDEDYPTDWFSVDVSGTAAHEITLEKRKNGFVLSADQLREITIRANNRENEASINFSTDYQKVFVYEIDENTIGLKVDTDNNGTFETELDTSTPLENTSVLSAQKIIKGGSVKVSANASGGKGGYQYAVYYKPKSGSTWTCVQSFKANRSVTITPKSVKSYTVRVKVKDASGSVVNKDFTVTVKNALQNTSAISASKIIKGRSVKVTAAAAEGLGSYQYAVYYKLKSGTSWICVQSYKSQNTVNITPKSAKTYLIRVKAKDAGGSVVNKDFTVTVKEELQNTSVISAQTIVKGGGVTVTASAAGGFGRYQYAVYYQPQAGTTWTCVQSYGTGTTVTITPQAVKTYLVRVKVKDAGGNVVNKDFTVTVKKELQNTSTVSAQKIVKGSSVQVKASAAGGLGSYRYAVYYRPKNGSTWTCVQDYKMNGTVKITPQAVKTYLVRVKVKDAGGSVVNKDFTVTVQGELQNTATLSARTIRKGSSVKVTAKATGGQGGYLYAVYYKQQGQTNWTCVQEYRNNTTVTITPRAAKVYTIRVKVKDAGGSVVNKDFTLTVTA